jgi:peptidyl-dipeptidase Dcp
MVSNDFTLANNPIVNPPPLPHGVPALDRIRPEHFLPAWQHLLTSTELKIDAIKSNPAVPDFENTIETLEFALSHIKMFELLSENLSLANSNDQLDAIKKDIDSGISAFRDRLFLDSDLFRRVDTVYQSRKSDPALTAEEKSLLNNTYQKFVRSGANLAPAEKQRVVEINAEIATLRPAYAQNVKKAHAEFEILIEDEAELAGVPDRVKDTLREAAAEKGQPGKFLIRYDDSFDVIEYADNRALRQQLSSQLREIAVDGPYSNQGIVLRMLALRHEKAQLLGFDNHVDYYTSGYMIGGQQQLENFLKGNLETYRAPAEKEWQETVDFARQKDGITDFVRSDFAYYNRQLQEEKFSIDMESVRGYFELNNVVQGLFRVAKELFNIRFEPADEKYPVFDEDMKVFEVFDDTTGEQIGVHFMDYYARPGLKKPGAWALPFRDAGLYNGKQEIPISIACYNLVKPPAGKPTLLSPEEVETKFHEFGHDLHVLFGKGKYPSINGLNVKFDFCEVPSQLMENWAMAKEVLNLYAFHHETGEVIPDDLVQKLKDMKNFGVGYMGLRQTWLGMLDYTLHTVDPATITSLQELEDSVTHQFPPIVGGKKPACVDFGHLFASAVDDYSSGYFCYKFSEGREADLVTPFQKQGMLNRELGEHLRQTVLSGGDIRPADELCEDFMGRPYDSKALPRREGLLPPEDQVALLSRPEPPRLSL